MDKSPTLKIAERCCSRLRNCVYGDGLRFNGDREDDLGGPIIDEADGVFVVSTSGLRHIWDTPTPPILEVVEEVDATEKYDLIDPPPLSTNRFWVVIDVELCFDAAAATAVVVIDDVNGCFFFTHVTSSSSLSLPPFCLSHFHRR